jgi:hypothetical protein
MTVRVYEKKSRGQVAVHLLTKLTCLIPVLINAAMCMIPVFQ